MPNLLPLAHGAWGNLDELLPILFVAGFALILVILGFMERARRPAPPEDESAPPEMQNPGDSPDHYRLD